jgi:hypothetical protein
MVSFDFELNNFRSYTAIFLLIGLAVASLISSLGQYQFARSSWKFNGDLLDDPIIMANRLKLLEARLPANGTIGYLSEQDIPGMAFNPIDQDEEFVMTQYALAPRIIVSGADPALVIVNIPNMTPQDMARITTPFKLTLVEKFDFGLYLYRH